MINKNFTTDFYHFKPKYNSIILSKINSMTKHDISIWLDTYDDIFSDFDFRPYSEKALSDDFLKEVGKFCNEKEEKVNEVKLFLPANKRNSDDEKIISDRLTFYFKKSQNLLHSQSHNLWIKGISFALIGSILMLIASYISSLQSKHFLLNSLLVFFEPSGWFLVWAGLDIMFYTASKNKKELNFYNKLSKSKISFFSI